MADPADPIGLFLRRAIDLRRFENTATNDVRALLVEARDEIVGRLAKLDPTAVSSGFQRRRLQALQAQIEAVLHATFGEIRTVTDASLRQLLQVQGDTFSADLRRVVGGEVVIRDVEFSASQLRAIVNEQVVQGGLLREWWADMDRKAALDVQRQIRLGLTQGETLDQLVRRVRGTSVGGGRFRGGVIETTTRNAETIVRTAVNQVAGEAQRLVQERNADIAPRYEYMATLDRRTTAICRALDGKVFRVDDPKAPRPPQHLNCRSRTVPVVDWKALGLEPPRTGQRAAEGGPVPASWDYATWLREQPASTQDEVLGPARARMFRDGEVTLDQLVSREGRTLTLDELRARI